VVASFGVGLFAGGGDGQLYGFELSAESVEVFAHVVPPVSLLAIEERCGAVGWGPGLRFTMRGKDN
jgi:hypothetical protein